MTPAGALAVTAVIFVFAMFASAFLASETRLDERVPYLLSWVTGVLAVACGIAAAWVAVIWG